MKIALVSDQYAPRLGGIEMQAHQLACHLVAAGHDVHVITPTPGPDPLDGVRVHRLDVPLLPFDIPYTPRTFRSVTELLEREQFDVVHCHSGVISPFAFGACYLSQKLGIPTVVTSHCMWSRTHVVFRAIDKAVHWSRWPIVFSGVSEVAAAEIRDVVPPARRDGVVVIPNGIDWAQWHVEPAEGRGRGITLISVMRLARRKRPHALVRIFARVRRALPEVDVRLVIVGDGNQRASVRRLVTRLGLDGHVELTGRLSHEAIKARFAAADVFVAPGNLESFGIAALEARCAGIPVVAKRRAGIGEFVEHGREGLLAGTDAEMAELLVELVRDRESRRVMAKHNRETPPTVQWDAVVALNLAAYEVAIDRMRAALRA